jgi:hypothetical protein
MRMKGAVNSHVEIVHGISNYFSGHRANQSLKSFWLPPIIYNPITKSYFLDLVTGKCYDKYITK